VPQDTVITAVSHAEDPHQAVAELADKLRQPGIGFILFFCAAEYPLAEVARALGQQLSDIPMAGCTSAGEISEQGYCVHSITALGFPERSFRIEGMLLKGLSDVSFEPLQAEVDELTERTRQRALKPLAGHTFALTLTDGLSVLEEQVLSLMNVALGGLPQFGASAANHAHSDLQTWVFLDGEFHSDAAVLLLINTVCDFKVFSRHHLLPEEGKLVITAADEASRKAMELNARPAADVYAEYVDLPAQECDVTTFALNPLAVKLRDQYYVRGVRQLEANGAVDFYSAIEAGVVLTPMKRADMRQNLLQILQEMELEIGPPQLVIGCDCLLRRVEAEAIGQIEALSALFRRFNVIGFSTYGEHFSGMVFNQTITGVAIGQVPHD